MSEISSNAIPVILGIASQLDPELLKNDKNLINNILVIN